jgi:predicted dinucleotide-binding enzyme
VVVEPARVPGEHVVFVCGNDSEAKDEATRLLGEFGWPAERVLDLSDVTATRGTEMYIPLWLNPTPPDTTLTPPGAQHPATRGKA